MAGDTAPTVLELQEAGILFVEDGNHGQYRPLPHEFTSAGVAFIRASDLADGRVLFSTCEHINVDAAARIRKGIGAPHDLILSHKGSVGKLARVGPEAPPFVCSPQTTIWRALDTSRLDRGFLYAFMRSPDFSAQLRRVQGETDMAPYVSLTAQRLFRVPLPEIGLQRKIGEFLGSLDDKIELNRRMAATLEEMARALFMSWFVAFDPVRAKAEGRDTGLPADTAALFPSSFGEDGLPAGWTSAPLLDHARLVSGGTPKTDEQAYWDGPILWASAKDVSQCADKFLISTERTITRRGLEESATRMVPALSTVVVARGATTGRHCLFGRKMAMNQTCYALHSVDQAPFWLACTFTHLVDELVRGAHGSVFDTITTTTLQAAKIVYGRREVVSAFESAAQPFYARVLNLVEEAATLRDLRDTFLPKLLSGKLRMKDAEAAVEAA